MTLTIKQQALAAEALANAQGRQALTNYAAIFEGFTARGIPADQIEPRVNVLTYHAWRALGRQVKRGEHGVKVVTWIPVQESETAADGTTKESVGKRPWTATVFHISQTKEL